jgi:hypothetical protein
MSLQNGVTESVQIWAEMSSLSCLALLICELAFGMNNKSVENFLSFLESLGSPLFDAYNFSYA